MKLPMIAQIISSLVNAVLNPILILGLFGLPAMGVAGAAITSLAGQFTAAMMTGKRGFRGLPEFKQVREYAGLIYKTALPSIAMQSLYTIYIVALNLILAAFSDAAVTALGLYYKMQVFFFIPLFALRNCVVPVLSYNNAAGFKKRCREIEIFDAYGSYIDVRWSGFV